MRPITSQNMKPYNKIFSISTNISMHLIFWKHILEIHENPCQYESANGQVKVKPTQGGLLQLKQVLLASIQIQALLRPYLFILFVSLYNANSHYFGLYSL